MTGKRQQTWGLILRRDEARELMQPSKSNPRYRRVVRPDICTVEGIAAGYPSKIKMNLQEVRQMPVPKADKEVVAVWWCRSSTCIGS